MNNVEVDARQILNLFADLTSRQQKQVYKQALRKAANILTKESRRLLKARIGGTINHRNRWNNKTLGSGIKAKVKRDGDEAKVHIMGDFRLKFFEKGTNERFRTTRNGRRVRTGRMTGCYFFRRAKEQKEREIFDSMDRLITESIQRIYRRNQ